ncbi:hypothetical protein GF312_20845 [Candidatus Poribacteria bacterium]|nr:hypothetical protein [Candidatus Poribacteria bacterium]
MTDSDKIIDFTAIEDNIDYQDYIYHIPKCLFSIRLRSTVKTLLKSAPYLAELEEYLVSNSESLRDFDIITIPGIVLRKYDYNIYILGELTKDMLSALYNHFNYKNIGFRDMYPELNGLILKLSNLLIKEQKISKIYINQYRKLYQFK